MYQKKKALILTTLHETSDNFIKDVDYRVSQYKFLEIFKWTGDNTHDELKEHLKTIDILFVCPNTANLPSDILEILKRLINSLRLTIVFFRGFEDQCLPIQLGYCNSRVQHSSTDGFLLNVKEIRNLKSKIFEDEILQKYKDLIKDFEENKTINTNGSYLTGIPNDTMVNLNDWISLATTEFGRLNGCLIHKKFKILFCHWYGYNESDIDFSKDLTRVCIYYILFEHGSVGGEKFRLKLFEKIEKCQLGDINVHID
ncbi:hypothetical protein ABK040_010718 [Willaertia magna]